MELIYSPCKRIAFVAVLGIFIFFHSNLAFGQCQGDFSYQVFPSEKNASTGKIEISLKNPGFGLYTFKVYDITQRITLVQSREASSPEQITFENLKPSTYLLKIEWGDSCYTTLGGLEGIIVTEKPQQGR